MSQGRLAPYPAAATLAGLRFPAIIPPSLPRAMRALTLSLPACVTQADCRDAGTVLSAPLGKSDPRPTGSCICSSLTGSSPVR
jgi:hypothetical protein